MKILRSNRELSVEETFFHAMAPGKMKMKDMSGTEIDIDTWAIVDDGSTAEDGTYKEKMILSIRDKGGAGYSTNSPTFIKDFEKMESLFSSMGRELDKVLVIMGTSKSGREFVDCSYPM